MYRKSHLWWLTNAQPKLLYQFIWYFEGMCILLCIWALKKDFDNAHLKGWNNIKYVKLNLPFSFKLSQPRTFRICIIIILEADVSIINKVNKYVLFLLLRIFETRKLTSGWSARYCYIDIYENTGYFYHLIYYFNFLQVLCPAIVCQADTLIYK